jgi:hypothetical protein
MRPCVHFDICEFVHELENCPCPDYLPSLLPVLKRFKKLLQPKYEEAIDSNSLYNEGMVWGEIRVIDIIISHIEKQEARNGK